MTDLINKVKTLNIIELVKTDTQRLETRMRECGKLTLEAAREEGRGRKV